MSIIKMNEIKGVNPPGWVAKVERLEDGRPKFASYGIYVAEDRFVSIPLHYVLIDKLIRLAVKGAPDNIEYYGIPNDINLKLIKTKTADGSKAIPMLVPCRENQLPDIISCIGIQTENGESIISMETSSCVAKSYLDKNRKVAAMIMVVQVKDDVMQSTNVEIKYSTGIIDGKILTDHIITVTPTASSKETLLPVELEVGTVQTKFVKFNNQLIPFAPRTAPVKEVVSANTTQSTARKHNDNHVANLAKQAVTGKPLRPNTNKFNGVKVVK